MILLPFPRLVGPTAAPPLFRPGERGVNAGLGQVDFAAVSQVFRETLEQQFQAARPLPQLEASMTGLVRRIPARQSGPWGAGLSLSNWIRQVLQQA
jgi:hypothetical protein